MGRKLGAEFLGTLWLVLGGCGSAVLAAAFPDVGIGLLGVALALGCGKVNLDRGQTAAYDTPVPDGHVVLVKRGPEHGAFILSHQTAQPETTDYQWYYRADGQGGFSTSDPAVLSGHVTNATKIAFQSFSIGWSINGDGKGWVYFSKLPTQMGRNADYEMCITTATNLAGLNPADRKWHYQTKGSIRLKPLLEAPFQ